MPRIPLPRQVNGKELEHILIEVSCDIDFTFNSNTTISLPGGESRTGYSLSKMVPSLTLHLGTIHSGQTYEHLDCQPLKGFITKELADLDGADKELKPLYDQFLEALMSYF